MPTRVPLSASIGFVFLGIGISFCFGIGGTEFIPRLTDIKDIQSTDDYGSTQEVMWRYALKLIDSQDSSADLMCSRRKRGIPDESADSTPKNAETDRKLYLYSPFDVEEAENHGINKRFDQMRRNAEDMGFKSRPGFRSWGGKRSKFATWGGKRGKFATWGGKRSKFNNWGGKRSGTNAAFEDGNEVDDLEYPEVHPGEGNTAKSNEKRNTWKSWGGKRGLVYVSPTIKTEFDSQSKFSNWGGKRFLPPDYFFGKRDVEFILPYEQQTDLDIPEEFLKGIRRRGEFQSWGGKRKDENYEKLTDLMRKNKFSSWLGKRNEKSENLTYKDRPDDNTIQNRLSSGYLNSFLSSLQNDLRAKKIVMENGLFDDVTDRPRFYSWMDGR